MSGRGIERRHERHQWAACVLTLCLAGCGTGTTASGAATDGTSATGGNAVGSAAANATSLAVGFNFARQAVVVSIASRATLVDQIYWMLERGGRNAVGTITTLPGGQKVYAPTPADRLVVKSGQLTQEFQVLESRGSVQAATPTEWIDAPHHLKYVYRVPGQGEMTVLVDFNGRTSTFQLTGWDTIQAARYEFDLSGNGILSGDRQADSREDVTQTTLTGSIKGGGTEVDVQEQLKYTYVSSYSTGLMPSMRGWASQFIATISSTVRSGGETFQFANARLETWAKEKGGQSSSGTTSATGQIMRAGKLFAAIQLVNQQPIAVAGGTSIPLTLIFSK